MISVKQKITWLWQNAERLLIIVFLTSFTFNIRKVFLTPYSFLNGGFNEYTTFSLSWADTLIIAVIIIYTIKYTISQLNKVSNSNIAEYNNKNILSSISASRLVSYETILLVMFLVWAGLSITWSDYKPIAVYRLATLLEIAIFVVIAAKSLKNKKWLNLGLLALIINGIFQSILGIAQFIHNGAIGLHILGESFLGPNMAGVAKIIISGEKHIRAYGTMPHSNILAGFLLVPLFVIIAEFIQRKFLLTSSLPSPLQMGGQAYQGEGGENFPLLNKERARVRYDNASHETLLEKLPNWFFGLASLIIGTGFLLTFSRSAFLGIFVGLMFMFWRSKRDSIRSVWTNSRSSKTFQLSMALILFLVLSYMLARNTSLFSSQSLEERNFYNNVSHETLLKYPVAGVGLGQFVLNEYKSYPNLESWQYQPVHNIYLLIFSELGIVGLVLVFSFLIVLLRRRAKVEKEQFLLTYSIIYGVAISFAIISFFDHYFWDIKIGIIIFALPFLFLLGARNRQENVFVKQGKK